MGYEQIEHTADVGLRVWAVSVDELFAEAARGLLSVMGAAAGDAPQTSLRVEIDAPDVEALLVDWLSELLYLFEGRGVVPHPVETRVLRGPGSEWRLEAEVSGPGAERFVQHGPAVKAVTYHGLSVAETARGWEARVYLDV